METTPYSTPEDHILDCCIGGRLKLISRYINQQFEHALRAIGLRSGQLMLMSLLAKFGPLTAVKLAKMAVMDKSTLSRDLGVMKRAGWVVEAPGASAREKQVSLSAQGEAMLQQAWPVWQRVHESILELVGPEQASMVQKLTAKVMEAYTQSR